MLTFFYIGMFLGIGLAILIFIVKTRNYLYKNTNISGKVFYNQLVKFCIEGLLLHFLVTFVITFLLPIAIWNFGNKGISEAEMIVDDYILFALPNTNSKGYVGRVNDNNSTYVVNISQKPNTFTKMYIETKNTNIITTKKSQKTRYERVKVYKINQLTSKNFFSKATNDIYANIYLEHSENDLVLEKVNLYVPENSVIDSYKAN